MQSALVLWGVAGNIPGGGGTVLCEVVGYCAIPDALGIGFAHCRLVFWWVSEEDSAVSTRHILFLRTG